MAKTMLQRTVKGTRRKEDRERGGKTTPRTGQEFGESVRAVDDRGSGWGVWYSLIVKKFAHYSPH